MKRLFPYVLILFLLPFLAKAQNLEVEGDAKIGGLGGNGTEMVVTDNDGNLSTQAIGGGSVWSLNGLDAYYNDGRVGIGTSTPSRLLHVHFNNANQNTSPFLISQAGTGDAFMNIGLTGGTHYAFGIDNSDSDKFKIGYQPSNAGGVAQNTLFTMESDGDVGVGTTSPSARIHVERPFSTSVNEPMVRIDNNSNQTFGAKTGLSVNTSLDGNTGRTGIQNITNQNSSANGTFYGILNNNFPGGSATSYGIRNLMAPSNVPTGQMYGISNSVNSDPLSSGLTYGIYNEVTKDGTGKHVGIYNKINGSNGDSVFVSINTDPTGFAGYFRGNVRMHDADLTIDGKVGIGTTGVPSNNFEVNGSSKFKSILVSDNASFPASQQAVALEGNFRKGIRIFNTAFEYDFNLIYGVESIPAANGTSQTLYGVYSQPTFSSGTNKVIGVYASKQSGGASGSYALSVNGDAFKTGAGVWTTSDQRLKKNVKPIRNALSAIQQLKPSTYFYKNEGKYVLLNLPVQKQYGFIAQDVEAVMPDFVKDTPVQFHESVRTPGSEEHFSEEYKAMNYQMLIPLLTQGIKEQQEQIEKTTAQNEALRQKVSEIEQHNQALEARLTKLEQRLTQNTSTAPGDRSTQVVELNAAKLYQNEPNPFNRSTRIAYDIPNDVQSAALYITTADGKPIKQIPIAQRGSGQTILQAGTLPAGRYQYTLLLDGKITATKQMVLTK